MIVAALGLLKVVSVVLQCSIKIRVSSLDNLPRINDMKQSTALMAAPWRSKHKGGDGERIDEE